MNAKISNAQIEVWEWKNALHEEIKDMEINVGIKYLLEKAELISQNLEKEGTLRKRKPL